MSEANTPAKQFNLGAALGRVILYIPRNNKIEKQFNAQVRNNKSGRPIVIDSEDHQGMTLEFVDVKLYGPTQEPTLKAQVIRAAEVEAGDEISGISISLSSDGKRIAEVPVKMLVELYLAGSVAVAEGNTRSFRAGMQQLAPIAIYGLT